MLGASAPKTPSAPLLPSRRAFQMLTMRTSDLARFRRVCEASRRALDGTPEGLQAMSQAARKLEASFRAFDEAVRARIRRDWLDTKRYPRC